MSTRSTGPRYLLVAADVAGKIADNQYPVGERVYTRSSIASQYAVSPETARRAIAILSDLGIVEAIKGSGVIIRSQEKALQFIQQYKEVSTLGELRRTAIQKAALLSAECLELKELIATLVDRSDQLRFINPFAPYEITVEEGSGCINKSLSDLSFWQNTGATVIAVRRDDAVILSPGPYESFQQGDILYFIGDEVCQERVRNLITKKNSTDWIP